jgi:hypothetical protein
MRFIWRTLIFIFGLIVIYIAFPILIVPSKLPAIQNNAPADAQIYQLQPENIFLQLKQRHQEGMKLILAPVLP